MDRDTARVIVTFCIAAGVTWWMWHKGKEERTAPEEISPFKLEAARNNQPAIRAHIDRLRKRQRIPW